MNKNTPRYCRAAQLLLLALTGLFVGCERQAETTAPPPPTAAERVIVDPKLDTRSHEVWLSGIGVLDGAVKAAGDLDAAIAALLQNPADQELQNARAAWRRAHNTYMEFQLLSALSGSSPGLFGALAEYDFTLEAWPIQPGYLDYFDVYSHSGIVNDIAMPLTAEALREQHGFTDSSDVSIGFHALEYLLWGEDGQRPLSDFAPATPDAAQEEAGMRTVDLPSNRRRALLSLLSQLLMDDLREFKQAVENPNGLLRRAYLTLPPESRMELLRTAGTVLLGHHRDLLQAELDAQTSTDDGDSAVPEIAHPLQHSTFSGDTAEALAHSLAMVESVLFQAEGGLGEWIIEDGEELAAAQQDLASLRSKLLENETQVWPPNDEDGERMLGTLTTLADLLVRDSLEAEMAQQH